MNNPQQIDVIAECLKPIYKFGETIYVRVCTDGPLVTVPWGGADLALCVFLVSMGTMVLVGLGMMLADIIRG